METQTVCQSCGMPIDNPEFLGTEIDGTKNQEYCLNCYAEGTFRDEDMSLEEMRAIVISEMEKMNESSENIDTVVSNLEQLKRWN